MNAIWMCSILSSTVCSIAVFTLAPSAYEAGFMSIKHSNEDIDASITAADEIFADMAKR